MSAWLTEAWYGWTRIRRGPGQYFDSTVQGGQRVMKSLSLGQIAVFLVLLMAGCVSDGGSGSAPRRYTDPGTMWAP